MSWRQRLGTITLWALLVAPLLISPLLGLITPYATLIFVIPLFFLKIFRGQFLAAYSSYTPRAFLLVVVVLAILFAATAKEPHDVLSAFNFTMLLAYGAIAYFLAGHIRRDGAAIVTFLAAGGVVVGLLEIAAGAMLGHDRPTGPAIGPIVLSNGLLALGFLSLGGALLRRDRLAWVYVAAPLMAVAATLLTGSRGPLIAVPVAAAVAAVFFWRQRFAGAARAGVIGLAGLMLLGAVGLTAAIKGRAGSLLGVADTLASGGTVTDPSASQRFLLYRAGWQSFLQSPWIGHGWAHIMDTVRPFVDPANTYVLKLPQLHNDVLNFAVAGGVIGVICYFVVLTAPFIGALLSQHDTLRPFRIYATTMIMIVYAGGGLTDLMFGFEFHTFLFVMLNAIILGYCRDLGPTDARPVVANAR